MGIHFTRPTLPPEVLQQVQALATSLVTASPLANTSFLQNFFFEASQWLHSDGLRMMAPWQRGTAPFLEDSDRAAATAAGTQAWRAFHRPSLVYAACRGALDSWPEVWAGRETELLRVLRSVDLRGADGCAEALVLAASTLAWTALRRDAEAQLTSEIYASLLKQCHQPSLSNRIIHGQPSQTQQAQRLLSDAMAFLEVAVASAAQHWAHSVLFPGPSAGGAARLALKPSCRPRHPRPFHTEQRPSRCLFGSCAFCTAQKPPPCSETVGIESDDEGFRRSDPASVAPDTPLQWRELAKLHGPRGFYRLSELQHIVDEITCVTQELQREFKVLWTERPKDFLPWREHNEIVDGWLLFGTHLFGRRLEANCAAAPAAAQLAEALGAALCGYSVLLPGTHVEPHAEDAESAATRFHVGLQAPCTNCGLRVGAQVRVWSEGAVLAFDSTCDHEVWNFSRVLRAVLLLDTGARPLEPARWPIWLQQQFPDTSDRLPEEWTERDTPGHQVNGVVDEEPFGAHAGLSS